MRDEYTDVDGNILAKKDVVKAKRFSGEHWMYDEVIRFTLDNDALIEYHDKMTGFYVENGGSMSDEELDCAVYGICGELSA